MTRAGDASDPETDPLPPLLRSYVRAVDRASDVTGLVAMYIVFLMIGILSYASFMKVFFLPSNWTVEMAQFVMVAYFAIGGAYTLKEGEHVRMDLLYSGLRVRTRAKLDIATSVVLIGFLVMLQIGGIASLIYAIGYGEKSFSAWAPVMWPIKVVLNLGIFLMLLQAIAILLKDWALLRSGTPR